MVKKNFAKSAMLKSGYLMVCLVLFYTAFQYFDTILAAKLGEVLDVVNQDTSDQYALLKGYVITFAFLIITVLVLKIVFSFFQAQYLKRVCAYTRELFLRKTLKGTVADFNKKEKAHYQSVLINDMKQLEDSFYAPIIDILKKIATIIVAIVVLRKYSIIIILFVVAASLLPILLPKIFQKKIELRAEAYEQEMKKYTLLSNEVLAGYHVFKNFNAENRVLSVHNRSSRSYAKAARRYFSFTTLAEYSVVFSGSFVMVSVLIAAMLLSIYGSLSVGDMFAIYFISSGVTFPMNDLASSFPKLMAGRVFYHKYDYYAEKQSDGKQNVGEKIAEEVNTEEGNHGYEHTLSREIAVKDLSVTFVEQEQPTLKHMNLRFEIGKKYLLAGASGSGKSSLIKAILGYYDIAAGEITYDGVSMNAAVKAKVFDSIVYLPQHPTFFTGTIRENLSLFNQNIPDTDIEAALQTVELCEKIKTLGNGLFEKGLDMSILENAENFSGGEKQRLALARGLVKKAEIFILDEATSAIDVNTSVRIESKLLNNPAYTIIATTHRFHEKVLRMYNEIIMIRTGEIVEKGDFEGLLAQRGEFYKQYVSKSIEA